MKIIDLLNKIANGEIKEISKFIYKGDLYEQESNFEEFGNRKGYVCRRENGITLTTLDTLFDIHKLNDEVEIIEESKKVEIPKHIPNDVIQYLNRAICPENVKCIAHKVNEIINYLQYREKKEEQES